jgi:hypothetical protein
LGCGHSNDSKTHGDAAAPADDDATSADCGDPNASACAIEGGADDASDGAAPLPPWLCGDAGVFGADAGDGAVNWATTFGKTGVLSPGPVAIDSTTGEIAVVGTSPFGSADFGAGAVNNACPPTTLDPNASLGCVDLFVARFDACGGIKWGKMIGSGSVTGQVAVAVGHAKTVVGGQLSPGAIVDFGCGPLSAIGTQPFFVAVFDDAGSCVFSKGFGSTKNPTHQSMTALGLDSADNVLLAGAMTASSPIDFGGGPLSGWTFVVKLGPDGRHLWSNALQARSTGPALAVDGSGNAILATTVFPEPDADILSDAALSEHSEAALIKYDPSGNEVWSKVFDDIAERAHTSESAVAVDAQGNVALLGFFSGAMVDFGMGYLTANASGAAFVVLLDPAGGTIWRKALQPVGATIYPGSIAIDDANGVTITTSFSASAAGGDAGTIDFGGGSQATSSTVAHFDSTGKYKWAYTLQPSSGVNGVWATLSGVAAARATAVVAGGVGESCSGTSACLTSPPGVTVKLSGKTVSATSATDTFLASFGL